MSKKLPSKERGCDFKIDLGRNFAKEADKLSRKWKKKYAVYRCPHCGKTHLTTKTRNPDKYDTEILHITPNP